MAINDICHKHNIGFIKSDTYGVFAGVFCDFGKQFHVLDIDGKQHWQKVYHCHKCYNHYVSMSVHTYCGLLGCGTMYISSICWCVGLF